MPTVVLSRPEYDVRARLTIAERSGPTDGLASRSDEVHAVAMLIRCTRCWRVQLARGIREVATEDVDYLAMLRSVHVRRVESPALEDQGGLLSLTTAPRPK